MNEINDVKDKSINYSNPKIDFIGFPKKKIKAINKK
jgi:hypothetical protein